MELKLKKCRTPYCRGLASKVWHSPFCAKCRTRRFKEKHPMKYFFSLLRNRSKARGKDFSLTFEQYQEFALRTDYARLKGKSKYSMSINRIDPRRGYSIENIESISLSENSRLRWANIPAYLKEEAMAAEKPK